MLKAKEIVLGEVSNKVAATNRREKGYFGSYEARQTALNYCAAKIAEYNFDNLDAYHFIKKPYGDNRFLKVGQLQMHQLPNDTFPANSKG